MTNTLFDTLQTQYRWRPIRGCPGRFVLAKGVVAQSISELIGTPLEVIEAVEVVETVFKNVPDPVTYCEFEGGGIISYRKPAGYLHTLCDSNGFKRKLDKLKNG